MMNLTPYNKCNEREINAMVGKAMCAYANWMDIAHNREKYEEQVGKVITASEKAAKMSEYEATVRCIDMFVRESIYEIQFYVVEKAKDEFGI